MKVGEAKQIIGGGLGRPSKMPGRSYGLPARACIIGSRLAKIEGSVCHGCYALKGNYIFPSVQNSQQRRLESLKNPRWIEAMVFLISRERVRWFRWHDSGDLQSVNHLDAIVNVAKQTPRVKHWLPTREFGMVQQWMALGGVLPPNLVVRVSATMIDGAATKRWPTTSGVYSRTTPAGAHRCPAPDQGNNCGKCRACWSGNVEHVVYHMH